MPPPFPTGPPPPPPPLGLQPAFNAGKSKDNGSDNRGALLQSIRHGAKLKKTVTNDKSAPMISGKVGGISNNSNNNEGRTKALSNNNQSSSNGMALGGLFAGGMPKLRSTGILTGATPPTLSVTNNVTTDSGRKPSPEAARQSPIAVHNSQLNEVLKRQMAGDFRNRGPPPQPPTPRSNLDSPESPNVTPVKSVFFNKQNSDSNCSLVSNKSSLYKGNSSFLHQNQNSSNNSISNSSISVSSTNGSVFATKPTISHGKPNLAPKPPPNNNKPATPPKKLMMNGRVPRTQSMRVPRSPPVAPPVNPPYPPTLNGKDFGTIRGVPTMFYQSEENLSTVRPTAHHSRNQTLPVNLLKSNAPPPPPFNTRPVMPPPNRPPVPPPPSRTGSNVNLKAPLSPPPPPPTSAPPPPPHRTSPAPPPPSHTRPPPAIPSNGPPPPPVRNSSMRNGSLDLDTRFSNLFRPVTDFPRPCTFRGFSKLYSSKNAVNKQQAPLPPNSITLGNKLCESSTC